MSSYHLIQIDTDTDYLTNEKCDRSSLKGLEYAKYLRRVKKDKSPILFTSFMSLEELNKMPKTQIIKTIGHKFLQQPYTKDELEKVENTLFGLEDIELKDIIHNFCEQKSFIRESFHALKGDLRNILYSNTFNNETKIENIGKVLSDYRERLHLEVGFNQKIIAAYEEILITFNQNGLLGVENIIKITDEHLSIFLPKEENESLEELTNVIEKKWKVLLLDDEIDQLNPILEELSTRKIGYFTAKNSQEAMELIKQDEKNFITVIISDFRLLDEKKEMQRIQGYRFLIEVAKMGRFNGLIALSGLDKWFLMDSFRNEQVNVNVYSKNNVIGNGEKTFVDEIENIGSLCFETTLSIPTQSMWEKQMIQYYKWLKLECPYSDTIEHEVAQQAEDIVNDLERQIERSSRVKILNSQSGGTMSSLPEHLDLEQLDIFKRKLVLRRVLIYFSITGKLPLNTVCKILSLGRSDAVVTDQKGKQSNDQEYTENKKQIFTQLALKESDIPFNILIEEKLWLNKKMGIDIVNGQVKVNVFFECLEFAYKVLKDKVAVLKRLPNFDEFFNGGKSISKIDDGLKKLLKQLYGSDKSQMNVLINSLKPILEGISDDLKQANDYEKLLDTLKSYQNKP